MEIVIKTERPNSVEAVELVEELDAHLIPLYPAESHHGYDVARLLREEVAFFIIYCDGAAAGCGGVQLVGQDYGELKRMYVRPQFRGLCLAKRMLEHIEDYTRGQGVEWLRLETGNLQAEAIGLYERAGFRRIGPFGDYWDDPLSLFFEKRVSLPESP